MKLVEILARDLGEWPEGYLSAAQTTLGSVYWMTTSSAEWVQLTERITLELADDYQTAIVTREQWEAARNVYAWPEQATEASAVAFVDCKYHALDPQLRQNLIALGWLPPEDVRALRDLLNRSMPA